jgi:LEA14-like dessication related protein
MANSRTRNWGLLIAIASILLLSVEGCRGTVPGPLSQPIQKAVEQAIKAPSVDLRVNIGSLSPNGLNVGIEAAITNSNSVTLDIGNLQVVAKGGTGRTYVQDTMPGGSVAPNSSMTFTHDLVIPLDVLSERSIVVAIDTRAGAAGITLPVSGTVTVNMPDIQHLITTPGIALSVNIGQLSSSGLSASLQAVISNPNPLSVNLGDMQIVLKGQSGNTLTTSTMVGGSIAPNSSGTFTSNIQIPLQVLNERTIVVTINTSAGVAGITLPVTATVTVNMPDIHSLVSIPQVTINASPSIAATFPLPSLKIQTDVIVANSNSFGLVIGELHVNLFKSDGSLLKAIIIPGATIYPNSSQTFSNSIILGSDIILGLIGSSSLTIEADSQAGISGINDTIPIKATFILALPHLP